MPLFGSVSALLRHLPSSSYLVLVALSWPVPQKLVGSCNTQEITVVISLSCYFSTPANLSYLQSVMSGFLTSTHLPIWLLHHDPELQRQDIQTVCERNRTWLIFTIGFLCCWRDGSGYRDCVQETNCDVQ